MSITQEEARAELARRELTRRGIYPKEEQGFLSKLGSGAVRVAEDIDIGANKMGRNVARFLHLPGGDMTDEQISSIWGQKNHEPSLADKMIQGLAQYAPAFLAPGANLGGAGHAIGSIPKVGGYLAETASQAIPQAAFGATQEENPLQGAAEGAIGAGIGTALGKGINSLRPSKMFRGKLTPEELAHNLEITQGTETALGRIIESPTLMRAQENILPNTMGSGAEKTMERNAADITKKGQDLFSKMHGGINPENYGIELQTALKSAEKEARAAKNATYDELNKLAESNGINIGRENFQKTAKDIIKDIRKSPELEAEFGKDLYNDLVRYSKNKEGNNLKLTNIFRGKLSDKANELFIGGKKHESGLVKGLKESLDKDIEHSFNSSGNDAVKEAYQKAQKQYKEHYAPFEDRDIVKFTRQGGDPDLLLNHFIRHGKNDRSLLLNKIAGSLRNQHKLEGQKSGQELLTSAYFSKAVDDTGKFDPVKFSSLYQKLGKNQRKALFNDKNLHKEVKNYSDLIGKNKESFQLMANPKTGARNTEILTKVGQIIGGSAFGVPGVASLIAAGLSGKVLNKALTSEKLREKLINSMIKNKDINTSGLAKAGSVAAGLGYGNEPMELELIGGIRE